MSRLLFTIISDMAVQNDGQDAARETVVTSIGYKIEFNKIIFLHN